MKSWDPHKAVAEPNTSTRVSIFFRDHFPGKPLMPAVLLIECAAQAAGALWASIQGAQAPTHFVLAQVLHFKILQPVLPGQTVTTSVTLTSSLGCLAQFDAVLSVDQREVARGRIVLGISSDASLAANKVS